ncbi:MAG: hypothetical protein GYA55_11880 [SAR324 cluster bacterium]|uniref:Uncharacterized protein n=1 Tax=SAR324 cluster bacterium TaxID=2024889 RepID=A0A7X9IK87_9DELT|nr:hypothetical protein [SAR324 cluster bacterium]
MKRKHFSYWPLMPEPGTFRHLKLEQLLNDERLVLVEPPQTRKEKRLFNFVQWCAAAGWSLSKQGLGTDNHLLNLWELRLVGVPDHMRAYILNY